MSNQLNNCGQSGGVSAKGGTHDGIVNQSSTPEKRGRFKDYSSSNAENVNANTPPIALRLPNRGAAKAAASSIAEIVNPDTPPIANRRPVRAARKATTVGYDSDSGDSGSDDVVWDGSPPRGNGNASKKRGAATKTAVKGANTMTAASKKKAATSNKAAEKTVVKKKQTSKYAGNPDYYYSESAGRWQKYSNNTSKEGIANIRIGSAHKSQIRNALNTCLENAEDGALPSVIQDVNGEVTLNKDIVCFSTRNRIKLKHSKALWCSSGSAFPKLSGKCYSSKLKHRFVHGLHLVPDEEYTPAQIRDGPTYWSHPKLQPGCDIFAYDAYDE